VKFDPEVEMLLEFARTAREPPSDMRLQNLEAVRRKLGVPGATAPTRDGAGTAAPERLEHLERTGVRTVPSSPRADTLTRRPLPASGPARISASLRQLVATGVVTGTVGVLIGFGLGLHASDTALEGQRSEQQGFEGHGFEGPGFEGPGFEGPGFEGHGFEGQGLEGKSAAASLVRAATTEGGANQEMNAASAARGAMGSGAATAVQPETPRVASALESTPMAREQKAPRGGLTGAKLAQQASPSRARAGRSSSRPGDARPARPIDRSFFVALRLIERARHALDVGEPMLAQSLLDELDERFPPDLLGEERLATRALGWCALGERARAESAARQLLTDSPRSIYAERLEQSCVRPRATGSK